MADPVDIKPGDIYWVNIPRDQTVGSEQYKRRPFVIVSRLLINRSSRVVVGVPLTTGGLDRPTQPPHRIIIPSTEIVREIGYTDVIEDTVALTDQVRVLAKERLERKRGVLSATALASIGLGLSYLFDLR